MIKKINLDKLLAIFGVLIFAISIITFWGTFKKKSARNNGANRCCLFGGLSSKK